MSDNRGDNANDVWLTPREWVQLLGPFDLDPCCPPTMPWRTANYMVNWSGAAGEVPEFPSHALQGNAAGDGLALDWSRFGRVFANFPYSDPLPWVQKMAEHGKGTLLGPGKSPDSRWGQLMLNTADLVFFPKGRYPFHYEDGTLSKGKWNPHVFAAYGAQDQDALIRLALNVPGVLMAKAMRTMQVRRAAS